MSYTEIRKRHEIVIEFIDEKRGLNIIEMQTANWFHSLWMTQPDIAVQKSHRKYRMH